MTHIFDLGHRHQELSGELARLLGAKGANLAVMTSKLGLPVPAGFTITTKAMSGVASGRWPDGLDSELHHHIATLERSTGRGFGDPDNPLLVSVRSGAAVSMPGMLDTVLNVGMDDLVVEGLAARTGDERFARDCFCRFLVSYGTHVMGVDPALFEEARAAAGPPPLSTAALVGLCQEHHRIIARATGSQAPREAHHQLRTAIEAVARSSHGERTRAYRTGMPAGGSVATAVTVQAMVYGNLGETSAAGVACSRHPLTGAPEPFGEVLFGAQGEDVVSGAHDGLPLAILQERIPSAYEQLLEALALLEAHFEDMCEVELTVEEGRLWLLQSRVGARSPAAAVRMAVDMATQEQAGDPAGQGGWSISKAEAVARVSESDLRQLQGLSTVPTAEQPVLALGTPASPGVATGVVAVTVDRCLELAGRGDPVILVRPTTSPADVAGLRAAAGVLTTTGGATSHAAVVARAWGIPAVVGASEVVIDGETLRVGDIVVGPGDVITIDGATGEVLLGARPTEPVAPPPELETLLAWRAELGID